MLLYGWGMPLVAEHLAATQLRNNNTSILFKLSDLSSSAMKLLFLGYNSVLHFGKKMAKKG